MCVAHKVAMCIDHVLTFAITRLRVCAVAGRLMTGRLGLLMIVSASVGTAYRGTRMGGGGLAVFRVVRALCRNILRGVSSGLSMGALFASACVSARDPLSHRNNLHSANNCRLTLLEGYGAVSLLLFTATQFLPCPARLLLRNQQLLPLFDEQLLELLILTFVIGSFPNGFGSSLTLLFHLAFNHSADLLVAL